MTTSTYLFYDTETTGLNPCFDQVIQFAAIRTDLELNEIERHEINVRLNPDVIPSPQALITHRIPIQQMQSGINELEAMQQIHVLVNTPGTISVGYNTLGFDDEFLRFAFYRNLLAPYTHQFANQCSRMDIYPMTLLYYLFKPKTLKWPEINGKVSLKLENLNQANQLAAGRAHDAMVDVIVTLELARRLKEDEKMWNYVTGFFNKQLDSQRLQKLPVAFNQDSLALPEALLIQGKLGHQSNFQTPVMGLGQHQHYRNQTLWLRLDQTELQNCTPNTIAETTYVIRKRLAEPPFLLPSNKQYCQHLSAERLALTHENKQWLQANPKLLKLIGDYHQHYQYPTVPQVDADAALYSINFATPYEENLFNQFHQAAAKDKQTIALQIPNTTRRQQALRCLARHYPQYLDDNHKESFAHYVEKLTTDQDTPVDYRNISHLTIQQALQECHTTRQQTLDPEQKQILDAFEKYLVNKMDEQKDRKH